MQDEGKPQTGTGKALPPAKLTSNPFSAIGSSFVITLLIFLLLPISQFFSWQKTAKIFEPVTELLSGSFDQPSNTERVFMCLRTTHARSCRGPA